MGDKSIECGRGKQRKPGGPRSQRLAFCGRSPEDRPPLPHTLIFPGPCLYRARLLGISCYHAGEPGRVVALASPLGLYQWPSLLSTLCMAEGKGEQGGLPSTGVRSSWTSPRPCASWKVLGLTLEAIITPTSSSTTLFLSHSNHQKGEVQRQEENSPGTHSTVCGGVWTGPGRLTLAILPTGEEAVARGAEAIVAALCVLAGMLAQAPHTALVKVWSRWG